MVMMDDPFNSSVKHEYIQYSVYCYVENRGPVEAAVKTGPV